MAKPGASRTSTVPAGRTVRRASVLPQDALNARGLRSRERLKAAARDVLNAQGYRNLRVQDITARAGVATGLFYRYFHDLREIVGEVARDFFAELLHEVKPVTQYEHRYDWIFATVGDVVRRFASNAGILACLFGLSVTTRSSTRSGRRMRTNGTCRSPSSCSVSSGARRRRRAAWGMCSAR